MVMYRLLVILALLGLTACAEHYAEPIALTPQGDAVRRNMAAQIIDPTPPGHPPGSSDAARAVLAVEAYRVGEVKDPTEQSTAPRTTSIE